MNINPETSPFSEKPKKENENREPACILNTFELNDSSVSPAALSKAEVEEIVSGQRPDIFSLEDLEILASIEQKAFGSYVSEEWLSGEEDFQEEFANLSGPQFLIRKGGKLVGFLHNKPSPQAYQNFEEVGLLEQDPAFQPDPETLYIEDIAGSFGRAGLKIWKTLKRQAKDLGFRKLICHGLNPRVNKILTRLGFRVSRRVNDWLGPSSRSFGKRDLIFNKVTLDFLNTFSLTDFRSKLFRIY